MKILLILILLLILEGCVSEAEMLEQEWCGKYRNNLIAIMGAPDNVMSDGKGGEIFTYIKTDSFTTPGYTTTRVTPQGQPYLESIAGPELKAVLESRRKTESIYYPPQTHTSVTKTSFWINSAALIYKVSFAMGGSQ